MTPTDDTQAMGDMPLEADYSRGEAVVRPREEKLSLLPLCGVACHNGTFPPFPETKDPRLLTMHQDIVPDSLDLQHGRGAIWCLDCHHTTVRNKLVDNFGNEISFNQPQKLCGKCHGPVYRDFGDRASTASALASGPATAKNAGLSALSATTPTTSNRATEIPASPNWYRNPPPYCPRA